MNRKKPSRKRLYLKQPKNLKLVAREIVERSKRSPSSDFGILVMLPDHKIIGDMARRFRYKMDVKAKDMTRLFGHSAVIISRLEGGRRKWDMQLLINYLCVATEISKRNKKKNDIL